MPTRSLNPCISDFRMSVEYISERINKEIISLLAADAEEMGPPLNQSQIENFMKYHVDIINQCVTSMYNSYRDSGELNTLNETALNDWFREFISNDLLQLITTTKNSFKMDIDNESETHS